MTVAQKRADRVLAGLSWQTIVATDLRERERLVTEFAQSRAIEKLCVLETPFGLQVGFADRLQTPVTGLREGRSAAFVLLVRRFFETDQLLLVWRSELQAGDVRYAVVIFEEGTLVLDRVLDTVMVEEVVTTYLENTSGERRGQFLSNDLQLFPDFTDISALDWMETGFEAARLRPPRRPRLIDPEKRPVQALLILLSLIAVSVALSWYVWTVFIAKPPPPKPKTKSTPEAAYLKLVTTQIASLGWSSDTVRDVLIQQMETPLTHEGWHLRNVTCDLQICTSTWVGIPGSDPRALSGFGVPVSAKAAAKAGGKAARSDMKSVQQGHAFKAAGLVAVDRLRSRQDAHLYCERERFILNQLALKPTLDCNGVVWPDKAPKVAADLTVMRYRFTVSGDWVTLDRLLDRYSDAVYWREVRLNLDPGKTTLMEMLQFELSGDLYAYR